MAVLSPNTFTSKSTGKQHFYLMAGPSNGPLIIFLHGWPGIALTWKYQLHAFASLGFYVVAPDMAGYGQTWTSKDPGEFALEKLVPQYLELLEHVGRKEAIWCGHDWGCGPLWAIASHHPEVCKAVIGMSVPYRTLELGLNYMIPYLDRELYPEDEFPYGQYDYQVFYQENPEAATRQFESDIPSYVRLIFSRGQEKGSRERSFTVNTRNNGGWFEGPNTVVPEIPLEMTVIDEELRSELVASLTKNGFHGATNWYLNHSANEKYGLEKGVNNGVLKMPVLFIHTEYDTICQTVHNPRAGLQMREHCENLSEFVIKAAHWGMLECPDKTNAGIVQWILEKVRDSWPGPESRARASLL
ncbi:hypothetical protein ACEPPN_000533 [Leptodophora sp. 'Broadleaf-Isolate-01']